MAAIAVREQVTHQGDLGLQDVPQGAITRADLRVPRDLKRVFVDVRGLILGSTRDATRDEVLAREFLGLVLCKFQDEMMHQEPSAVMVVARKPSETESETARRIRRFFRESVVGRHPEVFDRTDEIGLSDSAIVHVVEAVQRYQFTGASRDVVGDAFESFMGGSLRGAEGQFFTPRNVVNMMVEVVAPKAHERILDPACGSGGFLIAALQHVARHEGEKAGSAAAIVGIEKDSLLAKISAAYLSVMGGTEGRVMCEDSLANVRGWAQRHKQHAELGSFDVVLTNPPFGHKIKVSGQETLRQYDLAKKWVRNRADVGWSAPQGERARSCTPSLLFVERCLQFLRPGGRMGIVLPEGYWASVQSTFLWEFLRTRARVLAIVDLPRATFQTGSRGGTDTKTNVLFLANERPRPKGQSIIMGVAEVCGHDKNGNPTYVIDPSTGERLREKGRFVVRDDLPEVAMGVRHLLEVERVKTAGRALRVVVSGLQGGNLVPRYYDQQVRRAVAEVSADPEVEAVTLGDLVDQGVLMSRHGHAGIRSEWFGLGTVPYVRTSDLVNFEVHHNVDKCVPVKVYERYAKRFVVSAGDVLLVRRGRYRIGNVAIVSESDLPLILQGEITLFRVVDQRNRFGLNPHGLLGHLSHPLVRRQIKCRVFVETTLQNLAERWRDVTIFLWRDPERNRAFGKSIRECMQTRHEALTRIKQVLGLNGYQSDSEE